MKKKSIVAGMLACSLIVGTGQAAKGTADPAAAPAPADPTHPNQPTQTAKDPGQSQMAPEQSYLGFTHLIGREVRNDTGERLGIVDDLIINLDSHTTPFAIIRYGGTLGMGGTRVAVPLKELKWSGETKAFSLAATKEQFQSAMPAPTGGWAAAGSQEWASKVDRFYGDPGKSDLSQTGRSSITEGSDVREFVREAAPPRPATVPEAQPPTVDPGANQPPTLDPAVKVAPLAPAEGDLSARVTKLINRQAGAGTSGDVQATVENGVVTLKGKVATAAQKQDLETQIKALSGVAQVIDDQLSAPNE